VSVPSPLERADALIIGAGAIGTAIAFELSKLGMQTLNVDRMSGPGQGSTGDSASIVRVYASTREAVGMSLEAVGLWQAWGEYLEVADEPGLAHYVRTGSLLLKSRAAHHERTVPHLEELAVPFEHWTAQNIREHLPIFDVRSFWPPRQVEDDRFWDEPEEELDGGVYVPEGGYVNDPALAAHNLQTAARARGARFLFRATVTEILQAGGRVRGVRLADGRTIEAPVVVNVAGPHSATVNRMAGVEEAMTVRTQPLRHELHVVPAPEGFDYETQGLQVSDGDLGINFRPETGNQIMVGSEDPPGDPRMWVADPDDFDRNATQPQWQRQVYRLARRIPSLSIPFAAKGLAGLYDVSDDALPIYDRSDLDGFYMAVGTNGNQFKLAPVIGRLMASLIDACEHGRDHDAEPVAFRGTATDVTFDTGAFSRRRTFTGDSVLNLI
jgi:sarcosine oxidase, subunit beta